MLELHQVGYEEDLCCYGGEISSILVFLEALP